MSKTWIDDAFDEVDRMTPETGINVVAVDSHKRAGDALYLVKHCTDPTEAETARAEHESRTGDTTYLYKGTE